MMDTKPKIADDTHSRLKEHLEAAQNHPSYWAERFNLNQQQLRLKFGEMTAQEMRLSKAILAWVRAELSRHRDKENK
jgi:hypothetical protein